MKSLLDKYPRETQAIISATRKLVREILVGAKETIDERSKVIGYSYSPGYTGLVCTLILSQRGVKIGIVGGSKIPDPRRLLQGSGKLHRHISIQSIQDLQKPGVKQIIRAAHSVWKRQNRVGKRVAAA
jgi:hypothetical protein